MFEFAPLLNEIVELLERLAESRNTFAAKIYQIII